MSSSPTILMGVGIADKAALKLGNTIRTIAGAGTTQGAGSPITVNAAQLTTAGGATAFVLPTTWEIGDEVTVWNTSSTTALIFPQSGGAIDGGSTNASISLLQNGSVTLMKLSATAWRSVAGSVSTTPTFTTLTVTGNETVGGTLGVTGASTFTGQAAFAGGLNSKQSVANVHDTTPTAAELTGTFGSPATLGRGFVATVDDNDGDTNGYLVWTSDASWYWLKGTKAL